MPAKVEEKVAKTPKEIKKVILDKKKSEVHLRDKERCKEGFKVYGSYLHPVSFENYPLHIEHELFHEQNEEKHSYVVYAEELSDALSNIFEELSELCARCSSCCCGSCAYANGYFNEGYEYRREGVELSLFRYHKYIREPYFDKKKGYLREDGCVLPWWLRSRTCLNHVCWSSKDKVDVDYGKLEDILRTLVALKLRVGLPC